MVYLLQIDVFYRNKTCTRSSTPITPLEAHIRIEGLLRIAGRNLVEGLLRMEACRISSSIEDL